MEPLEAAIILQKNVRLKHETGQFFKSTMASHMGRGPYVVHPASHDHLSVTFLDSYLSPVLQYIYYFT